MRARTIFITGTDTGVGKTVLTATLLQNLLDSGVAALAMKPFCSGSRADVALIQTIQGSRLPDDIINPFYFSAPLAPLAAARGLRARVLIQDVVSRIKALQAQCDRLIIEGVGGLMVPLGRGFMVVDLIKQLNCPVLVVAPNRLGVLNHTFLTVEALQKRVKTEIKVVLREEKHRDLASRTNRMILLQTLRSVRVLPWPDLGPRASTPAGVKKNAKKMKKVLARLAG